ncbi:hypothetical protein RRG08_012830 [Elysia crispata]|uniref:Uncharacterized protein n=1 Tax=Elysia crispata TaxID=231223 RepID=A0AAE1CPI6_9GAST|nr:hypothetical protein RRG08_012830 [Elysia crispata]
MWTQQAVEPAPHGTTRHHDCWTQPVIVMPHRSTICPTIEWTNHCGVLLQCHARPVPIPYTALDPCGIDLYVKSAGEASVWALIFAREPDLQSRQTEGCLLMAGPVVPASHGVSCHPEDKQLLRDTQLGVSTFAFTLEASQLRHGVNMDASWRRHGGVMEMTWMHHESVLEKT